MARYLTVKRIISQASMEVGITQREIATAVGSLDQDIAQMVALLQVVADEVLLDEPYRATLGDEVWVTDANGVPKEEISSDNDFIAFDGRLAINGCKYRFLQSKGLEYGEQLRDFTSRMNKLASRVNGVVIDMYEDEGRVQ
jgi:hypothetical protein